MNESLVRVRVRSNKSSRSIVDGWQVPFYGACYDVVKNSGATAVCHIAGGIQIPETNISNLIQKPIKQQRRNIKEERGERGMWEHMRAGGAGMGRGTGNDNQSSKVE